MEKKRKNICVDVGEAVHRKAKVLAYSQGMTLKQLVAKLVEREIGATERKIFMGGQFL